METLKQHLITAAREIALRAHREGRGLTTAEASEAHELIEKIKSVDAQEQLMKVIDGTNPTDPDVGDSGTTDGSLYSGIMEQGYDRTKTSQVVVSAAAATGLRERAKAGSYSGNFASDPGVLELEPTPALGADQRFLFPRLRSVAVDAGTTSVQSYRQDSRTLAAAASMVRAIDAVTAKPETATVSELLAVQLQQVATVSSGTPNVLLETAAFAQWVAFDLQLAWRRALDYMVTTAITAATIAVSPSAAGNIYEDIETARSAVESNGYSGSLVVLSPGDALDLRLLTMASGVSYAFAQQEPAIVVTPAVQDGAGLVMDPANAGTLYLSPARLATFEEANGTTNSSTVRFENHSAYSVQRPLAICLIGGGS
jgi:hypothetical protein